MHEGKMRKATLFTHLFPLPRSLHSRSAPPGNEVFVFFEKQTKNHGKYAKITRSAPPNRYANSYGNVEPWNICKMVFAEPQIGTGDQFIRKNRAATPAGTTFSAIRKLPFRFRNSGTDHAMIAGRTTRKSSIPSSKVR